MAIERNHFGGSALTSNPKENLNRSKRILEHLNELHMVSNMKHWIGTTEALDSAERLLDGIPWHPPISKRNSRMCDLTIWVD